LSEFSILGRPNTGRNYHITTRSTKTSREPSYGSRGSPIRACSSEQKSKSERAATYQQGILFNALFQVQGIRYRGDSRLGHLIEPIEVMPQIGARTRDLGSQLIH
jgi:hypothetical protein